MTGMWLSISIWLDSACLWMTVFATLDISLMLILTGVSAGRRRFFGILAGTSMIVLASQWLIAGNAFGLVLGILPFEAAQQIGSVLALEFTRLRMVPMDLIYLPLNIILSWFFGARGAK